LLVELLLYPDSYQDERLLHGAYPQTIAFLIVLSESHLASSLIMIELRAGVQVVVDFFNAICFSFSIVGYDTCANEDYYCIFGFVGAEFL